jgi:hypothetical protein
LIFLQFSELSKDQKVTNKSSKQKGINMKSTTNLVEIPWTITTAVRPEKVQSDNGLWFDFLLLVVSDGDIHIFPVSIDQ